MWPPGYSGRRSASRPVAPAMPPERRYPLTIQGVGKNGKAVLLCQLFQYRVKLVTVRAMPLHKQHHLPVGQVNLPAVAEAEPAGAGFSVLADVPAAGCAGCAAMPCGFQSRSISSRVEACTAAAASNRVNNSDLMRDMSALLLPFHHGLLPGFQCLTLFPADTGNPCIQHLVCAEQHKDGRNQLRQKKAIQGLL